MMSGIRGKNTRPELQIRSGLHRLGYRYRLHVRNLPGKPDLVFPGRKAVIFVHGCYWHGHDCHLFRLPKTRTGFWKAKIETNRRNDRRAIDALQQDGWRVLTVWECALRGKTRLPDGEPVRLAAEWLDSGLDEGVLRGISPPG